MDYREYREGDTIRVTGCQGRLFASTGGRKLAEGVSLGVECVLKAGEDADFDVMLPEGILDYDKVYINVACIALVQAVEDKTSAIKHSDDGRDCQLFSVQAPDAHRLVAQIWYDTDRLPKEVAKAFAEAIKATYDSIVSNRKN